MIKLKVNGQPRQVAVPADVPLILHLVRELADGAFEDVSGAIRPDWNFARPI